MTKAALKSTLVWSLVEEGEISIAVFSAVSPESGRAVAENVLERLSGQTLEELEAANPGDPFAAVDHLLRTAEFEDQAEVLGCQPEELQLQACEIYGGLAYRARGQVARNFLDPYLQSCD